MEINRRFIRICVIIFGILVLASYVFGLSRIDDKMALWGGIPSSWLKFIVPFMFIAAIGWLIYWWTILYRVDASVMDQLRWPWQNTSDGNGANRLFLAYCLSIGNIMFGLLAYSAQQDGLKGANMMLAGAFMLSIQVVIFDGIVWNVKFPW